MKILYFFLYLWAIFAFLDPDPDPATQLMLIHADPDPRPCTTSQQFAGLHVFLSSARCLAMQQTIQANDERKKWIVSLIKTSPWRLAFCNVLTK
jgi:hypothetical protein